MPGLGIPTEWWYQTASGPVSGTTAFVTIDVPVNTGITAVIDHIEATVATTHAAAAGWTLQVQSPVGTVLLTHNFFVAAPAGSIDRDSFVEDLAIAGGVGVGMRIGFSAPATADTQLDLIVRGHNV